MLGPDRARSHRPTDRLSDPGTRGLRHSERLPQRPLAPAVIAHNPCDGPKRSRRALLGRDQELAHLYGMIDQIETRGGALVVRGEAGIGKSALLAAAGERARERGATVVTTTGTQSEALFAFGGSISCCFRSSTGWIDFRIRSAGLLTPRRFGLGPQREVNRPNSTGVVSTRSFLREASKDPKQEDPKRQAS